jgi:flagellar protein FliL
MAENKDKKEKKGGKGKFIIIGLLIIVFGGGGTFAGVYFYMQAKNAAVEKHVEKAYFVCGTDALLINLKDAGGKRYVKVKVTLGYDSSVKELPKELETNLSLIRDRIITSFNAKTADEALGNKVAIQKEIMDSINSELKKGQILEVVFSDFTVQ